MSYRRKPVSRNIIWLQKHWTPVFTGVTTFYEFVKMDLYFHPVPPDPPFEGEGISLFGKSPL
jgi:hypothetical protein